MNLNLLKPPRQLLRHHMRMRLIRFLITTMARMSTLSGDESGALPALKGLQLDGIPASAAAKDAVREALAKSRAAALS